MINMIAVTLMTTLLASTKYSVGDVSARDVATRIACSVEGASSYAARMYMKMPRMTGEETAKEPGSGSLVATFTRGYLETTEQQAFDSYSETWLGVWTPAQRAAFRRAYLSQEEIAGLLEAYFARPTIPTHGIEICDVIFQSRGASNHVQLRLYGQLFGLPIFQLVSGDWRPIYDVRLAAHIAWLFPSGSRERKMLDGKYAPQILGQLVGRALPEDLNRLPKPDDLLRKFETKKVLIEYYTWRRSGRSISWLVRVSRRDEPNVSSVVAINLSNGMPEVKASEITAALWNLDELKKYVRNKDVDKSRKINIVPVSLLDQSMAGPLSECVAERKMKTENAIFVVQDAGSPEDHAKYYLLTSDGELLLWMDNTSDCILKPVASI